MLTAEETQARLEAYDDTLHAKDLATIKSLINSFFEEGVFRKRHWPDWADDSGEMVEDELTVENCPQTLKEMLGEYSGQWRATYQSGNGKEWLRIDDGLIGDTLHYECFAEGEEPDEETLIAWAYGSPEFAASGTFAEAEEYYDEQRKTYSAEVATEESV